MICKSLLIQIPVNEVERYDEINSIDEVVEVSDYGDTSEHEIPPETEFWGHCSNLQAWYENKYDTNILVTYVAFPLLKKLTEVRDPQAIKVFKEEIAKRYSSGDPNVKEYLKTEGYLDYLSKEELNLLN